MVMVAEETPKHILAGLVTLVALTMKDSSISRISSSMMDTKPLTCLWEAGITNEVELNSRKSSPRTAVPDSMVISVIKEEHFMTNKNLSVQWKH